MVSNAPPNTPPPQHTTQHTTPRLGGKARSRHGDKHLLPWKAHRCARKKSRPCKSSVSKQARSGTSEWLQERPILAHGTLGFPKIRNAKNLAQHPKKYNTCKSNQGEEKLSTARRYKQFEPKHVEAMQHNHSNEQTNWRVHTRKRTCTRANKHTHTAKINQLTKQLTDRTN